MDGRKTSGRWQQEKNFGKVIRKAKELNATSWCQYKCTFLYLFIVELQAFFKLTRLEMVPPNSHCCHTWDGRSIKWNTKGWVWIFRKELQKPPMALQRQLVVMKGGHLDATWSTQVSPGLNTLPYASLTKKTHYDQTPFAGTYGQTQQEKSDSSLIYATVVCLMYAIRVIIYWLYHFLCYKDIRRTQASLKD